MIGAPCETRTWASGSVVILGAAGLLGRHVVAALGAAAREVPRSTCDVTRFDEVARATAGAKAIVNCAAYTNVDGAESDPDSAYRVNALGAENVARAGRVHDAAVVHVSTDFVFDGAQTRPYDEFDAPRPLSVYGRSKWAGEELARNVGGKLFVVRVQALYGVGGANFASKLHALLAARKPLSLDGERRVQPTWAGAASRQIVRLLDSEAFGTYHVSCHGETTWARFARRLAEHLSVVATWREVGTAELSSPAPRPPNCLFSHRMLALRGLDVMPDWSTALDEYAEEVKRS